MINIIDEHNVKVLNTSDDVKKELLICSCCERPTTLLDSVSYMGYNLHCDHCITKIANATGETEKETMIKIQRIAINRYNIEDNTFKIN